MYKRQLPGDLVGPAAQEVLARHAREHRVDLGIGEAGVLQQFDAEFIKLARSVYVENDERARIKKDCLLYTSRCV